MFNIIAHNREYFFCQSLFFRISLPVSGMALIDLVLDRLVHWVV